MILNLGFNLVTKLLVLLSELISKLEKIGFHLAAIGSNWGANIGTSSPRSSRCIDRLALLWLLVDQVVVFAFDSELKLNVFKPCTLFKDCALHVQKFTLHHFAFIRYEYQLAAVFKLTTQALKRLDNLIIASSRLPGLSGFTASKTDIGVGVICFLVCLKFECRMQRLVTSLLASGLPVLINGLGVLHQVLSSEVVESGNHHVVSNDCVINRRKRSLLSSRVFKHFHDAFKIVFRQGPSRPRLSIICLEEFVILGAHVILAVDALFDGL